MTTKGREKLHKSGFKIYRINPTLLDVKQYTSEEGKSSGWKKSGDFKTRAAFNAYVEMLENDPQAIIE